MAPSETSHKKQNPCSPENHGVRQPWSRIVPVRDAWTLYIIQAGNGSDHCAAYVKKPGPVKP
jgi:hypothetical protein